MMQKGRLELIIGPMYSMKTTELIKRLDRYKIQQKRVLPVKYSGDNRYSVTCMASHSGIMMESVSVTSMRILLDKFKDLVEQADVIGIDEGQFIAELDLCDYIATEMDKIVIVAGLSGDYKRQPFTEILKLIPLAESITKL